MTTILKLILIDFVLHYHPMHLVGCDWAFKPADPEVLDVKEVPEILDWLKNNRVGRIKKGFRYSTWLFHDKETKVAFILRFSDGQAAVTVGP